jgi:hypothetical protein
MKIDNLYKSVYWKITQRRRDIWEPKFVSIFKRVLNKQFKDLADKINTTNYQTEKLVKTMIDEKPIEEMLMSLYKTVGASFALTIYNRFKSEDMSILLKDETTDSWYTYLSNYVRNYAGKKITSITESGRDQALKLIRIVLDKSTTEGWGAEETAREIRKSLTKDSIPINQWRALRIARTEIVGASNQGAMLGAAETGTPLDKYWIATHDDRVREDHLDAEQQNPKEMNETFQIGTSDMQFPGDPTGDAAEVINCRCTVAFEVKGFNT